MINSAKQSISPRKERMDCFVASLLAMTTRCASAISRRDAPEVCASFPLITEGVGNAGCPLHPQPRAQSVVKHTSVVTARFTGTPGIPARNGFNGLFRALVSAKPVRMCERAVHTNRPSLDLSPFVLEGRKSLPGSEGQIRCLPQPEQLHGPGARTEQGRELDDGTK